MELFQLIWLLSVNLYVLPRQLSEQHLLRFPQKTSLLRTSSTLSLDVTYSKFTYCINIPIERWLW